MTDTAVQTPDSKAADWPYSSVLLSQPVETRWVLLIAVSALFAATAILIFGSIRERTIAVGQIVSSIPPFNIDPLHAGIIAESHITEGQAVEKGDLLFVIDRRAHTAPPSDSTLRRKRALESRLSAVVELMKSRKAAMQLEQDELREDLARLDEANVEHLTHGEGDPFPLETHQDQTPHASDHEARSLALARERVRLRRELTALATELTLLPLQLEAEAYTIQERLALLDEQFANANAARAIHITAPTAGRVREVLVAPGDFVDRLQTLASIHPYPRELNAELYIPRKAVSSLRPGDQLVLEYPSIAIPDFVGPPNRIRSVSHLPLQEGRLVELREAGIIRQAGPLHVAEIELLRQGVIDPRLLEDGMAVRAHIVGKGQRLYAWLLEIIRGNGAE